MDLSHSLPREDELLLEGRYHELNSEWDQAIQTYGSLWTVWNENPDYGLKLAGAQISADKGQDALATIAQLRKLPLPDRDDPRIDIAEAFAAQTISDFKHELRADEQALKNARATGASFVLAQGLMDECRALYKLGELGNAAQACESAQSEFALVGDKTDVARTATREANIAKDQGNVEEALRLRKHILETIREVGSQRDIAGALVNVADLMMDRNDLDGAQRNYEEAIKITRDVNDKGHLSQYETDLASVFYSKGEFEKTKRMYENVLLSAQKIDDKEGQAVALANLGSVIYLLGELDEAQKSVRTGLDMSRGLGTKRDVAASLAILGDILLAQGDLNGAEKTYVESAQIYEQMGEKGNLATSQISLATLALAKQSAPKAEELARQGVTECEAEGDAAGAATGRDILVQSLIEQNKVAEATEVMKEARKIQVQDVIVRLSLAVTEARLEGRTGNVDEALHSLDNTIKSARAMKLIGYELEARLAKAEVQLDAGATPTPPSDLKELVEEANAKGYHLIGLKAARL